MNTLPKVENHIITLLGDDYISVWIDAFLIAKQSESLSKHSIKFYSTSLKVFSSWCDGQEVKRIKQITPSLLREYLSWLESKGHNSGGINGFFRSVRSFLNWFELENDLDNWHNPILKVKPPRLIQEPITGVSMEDFNLLLSKCPKNTFLGIRDRTILMLMLDTGIRSQELCNIKIADVNLTENSIQILLGKGKKNRVCFIGQSTRKQLRKYLTYRKEGVYLFVNKSGERLVYNSLRQILRRLAIQAGVKVSLHGFRRSFALESLRKGIDILSISRLMGHSTINLIATYAKQTTSDLQTSYKSILDNE
jgi:integrase/recombinase XerD